MILRFSRLLSAAVQKGLLLVPLCLLSLFLSGCVEVPQTLIRPDAFIQDSFSDASVGNWRLESDRSGENRIEDGQLKIVIDQPQTVQYATLEAQTFSDFAVEVETIQLTGSPNSSYGILFRLSPEAGFYRFEITSNGLFVVEKHTLDGTERLSDDWEEAPAILPGLGQVNRLKVVASRSSLEFYVNNFLVKTVEDGTFQSGNVALSAGTFSQIGLEVAFDNLVIFGP